MTFDNFKAKFAKRGFGRTRATGHYLYCVGEGRGAPVKVGITSDVSRRMSQLQMHTWRDLQLFWSMPAAPVHEAAIKKAFASKKIKGEWFSDEGDLLKGMDVGPDADAVVASFINNLFEGAA